MTLSTPLVSVIVPIYQVEAYLEVCVDSILAQTLQDIEVILVDDGSPDGCPAICDAYAAQDSRVKVIHQENLGAGAARNVGLAAAKGEYVIFLDSDDRFEHEMLEKMLARAQNQHADIVICKADSFDESGCRKAMPQQLREKLLRRCGSDAFCPQKEIPQHLFQFAMGWAWDKLYRRNFVVNAGLQFQNLAHTNDAYFVYLSLVQAGVVSVEPSVLVHHRMHDSSISHNTGKSTTSLVDALLAIHGQIQPLHHAAIEKSFYQWAMNMAVWHYRQLSGAAAAELQQSLRNELEPVLRLLDKGAAYYPRKRDWFRYKQCVLEQYTYKEWKIVGIPLLTREVEDGRVSYSFFKRIK